VRRALRGVAYAMGLWLALVSAALVADATRVAPVEKVLTMLKDLTAKVEAEGEKEARAYDEYACFCKSTMKAKNRAIAEGTAKVATLQGDIASAQTEPRPQTTSGRRRRNTSRSRTRR